MNKQVNAPWILLFVNFRSYIFFNRAVWFPIVFMSTPDEMGNGKSSGVFLNRFLSGEVYSGVSALSLKQMFFWHRR